MSKNLILGVNKKQLKISKEEKFNLDKKEKKCNFCGINTEKYGHYLNKNGEWNNACSLCYYSENLDELIAMDKGSIVFINEISQVEIFGLMRMIWYIKELYKNSKNNDHLEEVYDSLLILEESLIDRAGHAENLFSTGASNVNILVDFLHSTNIEDSKTKIPLKYLRWIPNENVFREEIEYWNKIDYKKYHPNNFKSIIKQMEKRKNG